MSLFWRKMRVVGLPLLVAALGTNLIYTGGRWLWERGADRMPVTEELLNVWLPLVLAAGVVGVVMPPRLKRLRFRDHAFNKRMGLGGIALVAVAGPLLLSQELIEVTLGQEVERVDASAIETSRSRYLEIEAVPANFERSGWSVEVSPPSRNSGKARVEMVCVSPLERLAGEAPEPTKVWVGQRFRETLDATLPSDEVDERYREFLDDSWKAYHARSMGDVEIWRKVVYKGERELFLDAVALSLENEAPRDLLILEGLREEEVPTGSGGGANQAALAFLGAMAAFCLCVAPGSVGLGARSPADVRSPRGESAQPKLTDFFIPRKRNFVQAVLLNTIILVFVLMVIDGVSVLRPTVPELMEWGANRRPETTGGQWWRLLTSVFLHGGILHLALNCYGFLFGSSYVQWVYGQKRYAAIFFVSGICGSVASISWYENTASVGASGAIFGLFGAHTAMLMQRLLPDHIRKPMLSTMGMYLGINVIWGMQGGIDNAAHAGGFVSGFLMGIFFLTVSRKKVLGNMGLA